MANNNFGPEQTSPDSGVLTGHQIEAATPLSSITGSTNSWLPEGLM